VPELLRDSLPFVLPGLLPVLALLHVPLLGRRGRIAWALLLLAIAIAFVGDVLLLDHSGLSTLQVTTLFGRGDEGTVTPFVVETVTAPAWHWHVAAALWFGLVGVRSWLQRNRPPASRSPNPVPIAVLAFAWALAGRLALERTAAPGPVTWAVGVSAASFAILPFFGWYCGRAGHGFVRFAGLLLLANFVQRVLLVAVGFVMTTRGLGTHLDTSGVPEITAPGMGRVVFTDATHAWTYTMLIPQLTFALAMTWVLGLVVGALPWYLARRRSR
jgi:hypothetical protein